MDYGTAFETYMVFIAFIALTSWLPQIHRILKTKSTDDFSLITTFILVWSNGSFLAWAIHNTDKPLFIQQALNVCMLLIFTYLVIKYRSEPIFKRKE